MQFVRDNTVLQARAGAKGPVEAAAAGAQAARPPQRVAFNAACRVVAPDPMREARLGTTALARKPVWQARLDVRHLPVEVRCISKMCATRLSLHNVM